MLDALNLARADPALPAKFRAEVDRRFAAIPAIAHSTDAEGLLVTVSDAWLAKLGYVRQDVLGRRATDFLSSESRERATREIAPQFFIAGRCDDVQCQMVKKCGGVIDVLMSAVVADDPSGEGRVSTAVFTDITALVEAKRLLCESEARFRSLVEGQSELVSLATAEGELQYVNRAYAAICGAQPEAMIGATLFGLVPEDERAEIAERLRRVCETKKSESENEVVLPSGERRWIAWVNRALTDAEGRTVIHSVGRDVQAKVDANRRVQESETRYKFLAENSTDLILLIGPNGKRLYASRASRNLLGYEPEEVVALRLQDMIHPDDAPRVLAILAARPADTMLTYRLRRKDGGYVSVETTGRTVDVANGECHRLVIVRDIERRVEAERKLKASEMRYRLLAHNSTDVIMALDLDLTRTYVSPSSVETFGFTPEELTGKRTGGFAHPDDAESLSQRLQTLIEGNAEAVIGVNRRQHRDGRWIWVETCYRAVRETASGEVTGFVAAVRDVTARKVIEDRLAKANSRLKALAAQDALTGLANRRTFDEAIASAYGRAKQNDRGVALIMIDVDQFKSFNDSYGHPVGDDCLRSVANAISRNVRGQGDTAARYGGEEFAVVLAETDDARALAVAYRIQRAVLDLAIEHKSGEKGVVTVSVGLALIRPRQSRDDQASLLHRADQALYHAKRGGRNTVILAAPSPAPSEARPSAVA